MAQRISHLDAVNEVLRKLGADTVSATTESTYSRLVSDFVNQARKRVEGSLNLEWHDLRTETDIVLTPSTATYSITNLGESFVIQAVTNESRSREKLTLLRNEFWIPMTATAVTSTPQYYRLNPYDGMGDPIIELYPTPSQADTIRVWAWRGQGLSISDSEQIIVPCEPVILGAYLFAIEERGEDGGDLYAQRRYIASLAEAQARQLKNDAGSVSNDFRVE